MGSCGPLHLGTWLIKVGFRGPVDLDRDIIIFCKRLKVMACLTREESRM